MSGWAAEVVPLTAVRVTVDLGVIHGVFRSTVVEKTPEPFVVPVGVARTRVSSGRLDVFCEPPRC